MTDDNVVILVLVVVALIADDGTVNYVNDEDIGGDWQWSLDGSAIFFFFSSWKWFLIRFVVFCMKFFGTTKLVAIWGLNTLLFNTNLAYGNWKAIWLDDCFDCWFDFVDFLEEIGDFVVPNISFLVSVIGFFAFLCDEGRSVDASVGEMGV